MSFNVAQYVANTFFNIADNLGFDGKVFLSENDDEVIFEIKSPTGNSGKTTLYLPQLASVASRSFADFREEAEYRVLNKINQIALFSTPKTGSDVIFFRSLAKETQNFMNGGL